METTEARSHQGNTCGICRGAQVFAVTIRNEDERVAWVVKCPVCTVPGRAFVMVNPEKPMLSYAVEGQYIPHENQESEWIIPVAALGEE